MQITIIRNKQSFGPYDENALLQYVNQGQILLHDPAIAQGETEPKIVSEYLKQANLKPKIANSGNVAEQLKNIGQELIFPHSTIFTKQFVSDRRFLILALVGLLPMVIMEMPLGGFFVFYYVSLYFSMIWGLFFYSCFNTHQFKLKTTLKVFFLTQLCTFIVWDILGLPTLNPLYKFVDSGFLPFRLLGFTLGVGLTEEFFKALPLLFILWKAREPLVPQTMVYYGLISGIAFGVWEGVQYQMTVNAELNYTASFFLNIARLTSLPFLHACWCGIAGYFLAFAQLYPKYRKGLYFLAFTIPAIIHGLYDTFANLRFVPLAVVVIGLMLLIVYLKQSVNYQSKLRE